MSCQLHIQENLFTLQICANPTCGKRLTDGDKKINGCVMCQDECGLPENSVFVYCPECAKKKICPKCSDEDEDREDKVKYFSS